MSTVLLTPATRALDALVQLLEDAGITATRDAGAFLPDPIGVLVGLPSWVGSTLSGRVYEVPILVVSGQPLNTLAAVDRLYGEADAIARVAATDAYRPATWTSSSRPEPLPAIEIMATVTVQLEED